MKLWPKLLVIIICERRYLKENAIIESLQASLKLDTLDALMCVSLCGIEVKNINWRAIFEL